MAAESSSSSTGTTPRALVPLAPHPSVVPIDSNDTNKPAAEPAKSAELVVPEQLQPLAAIAAAAAQRSSPVALQPRPDLSAAQLLAVAAALSPMARPTQKAPTPRRVAPKETTETTEDKEKPSSPTAKEPSKKKPLAKIAPAPSSVKSGASSRASSSSSSGSGSSSSSSGEDSDSKSTPASPSASTSSASAKRANALSHPNSSLSARTRMMKKCTVAMCGSYARSRGLCKAHGGGKRCLYTGCELSDQGGGFCIRHGGGKRCLVDGCSKSAQSRHYCKAHGGGARCLAPGCEKSSQGGGFCRGHGGGPQRKKMVNAKGELVESPRSRKRSSFRANLAARALVSAAEAIESQEQEEQQQQQKMKHEGDAEDAAASLTIMIRPKAPEDTEGSPKSFKRATPTSASGGGEQEDEGDAKKKAKHTQETGAQEERDTQMFVAASLLGMQTAAAE